MLSKNVSNVKDLYHNKKMEGGGINLTPPPRQPVSKPEVRLNRVNLFATKYTFSYIAESKRSQNRIGNTS